MKNQNRACALLNESSLAVLAIALGLSFGAQAAGLPEHGHFVGGHGSIAKANQSLTVKQSSTTGIIDWSSFSVGAKNGVTFDNGSGATLNRVTGGNLSTIAGALHATGSLYIMNSAGVIVSGTGHIVTGGSFVATSGNIANTAFGDGDRRFKAGSGNIVNKGTIVSGGSASLVGRNVSDSGSIHASAVALSATQKLGISGSITAQQANGAGGTVTARGRTIVIGTNGAIDASASAAGQKGGAISAVARGTTQVAGTLKAEGGEAGAGGFIDTSGEHVHVAGSAKISTLAAGGKTGEWLIDPADFVIAASGGDITGATLSSELASNDVLIQSITGAGGANGDVIVEDNVTWSSSSKLTLDAYRNIDIDANISVTGAGNLVMIDADQTQVSGTIGANDGNAADGDLLFFGGRIAFTNVTSGNDTQLSINGNAYTLENNVSDLSSAIINNESGDFALANDYDASADGTYTHTPIFVFAGTFEGLGNTISNVTINSSAGSTVGFFEDITNTGTVRDFGLVNANVTSTNAAGASIGVLAGENDGTIENAYATGSVSDASNNSNVGGLVSLNAGGTIEGSHAAVTVTGADALVGGLVAWNESSGNITQSYATGAVEGGANSTAGGLVGDNSSGTISDSYATGTVTGEGSSAALGGLAGENSGTIQSSYATGAVGDTFEFGLVGGLVGSNAGGTIKAAYALGAVSVGNDTEAGGLVGLNSTSNSKIDESYETGAVTGGSGGELGGLIGSNDNTNVGSTFTDYFNSTANSGGVGSGAGTHVGGLALSAMYSASSFGGWNFGGLGSDWVIVDNDGSLNNASSATGGTLPMLVGEYSTTITNAHQLQLMELNLGATYTLANDIDASATGNGGDVWGSQGFVPIGGGNSSFFGTLYGAGHAISNLTIDSSGEYAALFGAISNGRVSDVGLVDATISDSNSGFSYVAALAGFLYGSVFDSYATGTVTGSPGKAYVGGLVGYGGGTITQSYATDSVSDSGAAQSDIGGLVGYGDVAISQSYATGAVTATTTSEYVGGLIGDLNTGSITQSYATGAVSVDSATDAGGLVGENIGTITQSFATGTVTAVTQSLVGGLVGNNNGPIMQSFATGNVTSGTLSYGGGLAASNTSAISNSYATGNVSVGLCCYVGGLVGLTASGSSIADSYAIGTVTGAPGDNGGLVGYDQSSGGISASYFDTQTTGLNSTQGAGNITNDAGITGDTTSLLQAGGAFSKSLSQLGFDTAVWAQVANSFPYLQWQFAAGVTPVVISGTIGTNTGGASVALYSGGAQIGAFTTYADGSFYELTAGVPQSGAALVYNNSVAFEDNGSNLANISLQNAGLNAFTGDASLSALGTALSATLGSTPFGSFTDVQGLTNALGGDIEITTGGNFDFDQSLDIGANALTLSGTGDITQSGGVVTAGALGGTKASGSLTMNDTNQIGTLSVLQVQSGDISFTDGVAMTADELFANNITLNTTGSGSKISIVSFNTADQSMTLNSSGGISVANGSSVTAATLTGTANGKVSLIGDVTKLDGFSTGGHAFSLQNNGALAVTGVVNTDGAALSLKTTSGQLAIKSIVTGSAVTLASAGAITESGGGGIGATTLTGSSGGAVMLDNDNLIADLGAFSTDGNAFALKDVFDLTTSGTVNTGVGVLTLTTVGSGDTIAVDSKLKGDVVHLVSAAGISESSAGDIEATTLQGSSKGAVDLDSTKNTVTDLGAFTTDGKDFSLTDDHNLTTTGTVKAGTKGDITLTTTGAGHIIAVDSELEGSTVDLVSAAAISESSAGDIDAKSLKGSAKGAVSLTNVLNAVINLGDFTAGKNFSLTDDHNLTVKGVLNAGALSLTTTSANQNLAIAGTITGSTVNLTTDGKATETAKAQITASKVLNVTAKTGIMLTSKHNAITKLGTDITVSGPNKVTL